ncbi:hypothetical protein HQ544_02315 [Candidatus Falkowbacteria bacterium]|nr:hypothetical protein [Candidatus Falkowbacteria bacterium]
MTAIAELREDIALYRSSLFLLLDFLRATEKRRSEGAEEEVPGEMVELCRRIKCRGDTLSGFLSGDKEVGVGGASLNDLSALGRGLHFCSALRQVIEFLASECTARGAEEMQSALVVAEDA